MGHFGINTMPCIYAFTTCHSLFIAIILFVNHICLPIELSLLIITHTISHNRNFHFHFEMDRKEIYKQTKKKLNCVFYSNSNAIIVNLSEHFIYFFPNRIIITEMTFENTPQQWQQKRQKKKKTIEKNFIRRLVASTNQEKKNEKKKIEEKKLGKPVK